ncbi:glycosyltransferase family 32 protein [Sphingobacterium sp. LRF_L2]|uniref:glycosyltransferase family 32 protein n=1 Tax=Sphingobacterium sp. LRF_L2 TaxID=3369421 RepID=UPI003F5F26BC
MAIPKVIYQTFKTSKIPLVTRFYIWRFMRKNPGYQHEFYDDVRIDDFIRSSFPLEVYQAYSRLQIGAAKADFFRYAILYIKGGIYLDLDSDILKNLDQYIFDNDKAVITKEKNHPEYYAQWALVFEQGHPFLKRTIDYIVANIQKNAFPNDVHAMTGPSAYTKAIEDEIRLNPSVAYRVVADDYKDMMKFKYRLGKILIYGDRSQHWKKLQKVVPVVKPNTDL